MKNQNQKIRLLHHHVRTIFVFSILLGGFLLFTGAGKASAATSIYRSVGVGATNPLATGTSNALSISGSTATFASALPDNAGVGDAVQYDSDNNGSIDSIAFVNGRTDSRHYTVKKADGSVPTATSSDDNDWSIFRAYISLFNAEAGTENTGIDDAVENFDTWSGGKNLNSADQQWNIACYANGTAADSQAVTVSGWTTGSSTYVNIYTPIATNEVGTSQRYQGTWNTSLYHMDVTDGNALTVSADYARIDGLQLTVSSPTAARNILTLSSQSANNDIRISQNLLKGHSNGSYTEVGIVVGDADDVTRVYNNIIYNIPTFGSGNNRAISFDGSVGYIYNNTIYSTYNGIRQTGGTVILKNNIVQVAAVGAGYIGTFDATSDYNISSNASETTSISPSYHPGLATSVSFADFGNRDLHLNSSDTGAKDQGVRLKSSGDDANLYFTTDVDNDTRPDSSWDIGADEYTAPDTIPPTVTAFTIPETSTSLTVPITTFTATDNTGVTGYLVNESASTPSASDPNWSASAPTEYVFSTEGTKTLYAWAKDAAGGISSSLNDSVTITLDVAPPTITAFSIPATSTSLTVPIESLAASDNIEVTGYMLTESASAPLPSDPGWSGSAPTNHIFGSAGSKTLYAWAKDAAGNVSASLSDSVTITLPTYSIGGTVSGLSGTVVLQNNGTDNLSRSADGFFEFATALDDGASYAVTVLTQPSGQTCTVSDGSGTLSGGDVTNVSVSCVKRTYWVSPTGAATWANCRSNTPLSGTSACSLATASANATAGDVVRVQTGTYPERVTLGHSGTGVDTTITFVADENVTVCGFDFINRSYIRVIGFTVDTDAGTCSKNNGCVVASGTNSYLEFWNNNFTDAIGNGIRVGVNDTLNDSLVIGNTMYNFGEGNGSGVAVSIRGDDNIISNNEIYNIYPDAFVVMGTNNRLTNNYIHDASEIYGGHSDIFQVGSSVNGWTHSLIEANLQAGMGSLGDEHTAQISHIQAATYCPSGCGEMTENIFRRNVWHNVSGGTVGINQVTDGGITFTRYYNNTTAQASRNGPNNYNGLAWYGTLIDYAYLYNNIEYETWGSNRTTNLSVYCLGTTSSCGLDYNYHVDYNLAYDPDGSVSFVAPFSTQEHGQANVSPQFNNFASDDFTLKSDSGARNTGGPLTTISGSGTGTTFNVAPNGGGYFRGDNSNLSQYGGKLVAGDTITVGDDVVSIESISGNAITVSSSFTWADGENVYFGSGTAPDIGAFPYKSSYVLSGTWSKSGDTVTVTPNSSSLVRFAVVYEDGIPKGVAETAPYSVSGIGNGTVTAKLYNLYASKTPVIEATQAGSDSTPPTVTGFTIPSTSNSLAISISTFTATDDAGVTGYLLTESATTPEADDPDWSGTAQTEYTFSTEGAKTLYAWAKDAAGNVSSSLNDSVSITLPTYTIGGTMSGLNGTAVFQNNGGDDLSINSNGSFSFGTALHDSDTYSVIVSDQPDDQTCTVTNGTGTVSGANVTNISVTCEDGADSTPPTVAAFSIPLTSDSLTIAITEFTATDDTAVTGYLLTESSSAPSPGDSGWEVTAQDEYTFSSEGAKTLYAWAKDGSGNVSESLNASIAVILNSQVAGVSSKRKDDHKRDLDVHSVKFSSTATTFTVTWKTDYKANSKVKYGFSKEPKIKKKSSKRKKSHSITIKNLLPDRVYYFKASSTDQYGNEDKSKVYMVRTAKLWQRQR